MKILVLNCGSSSVKYQLFEMEEKKVMVKGIIEKRVSAKLVPQYLEDLTSVEELDKLKINESFFFNRDRGTGRPTKKERRLIDKLKNNE
jgi:ribosome-associated heat shock protein Hsp15